MDKYHIYEEIGKGAFSQVFKGREKKKIEYVAIKRIEKSVMTKIVNEVQIMHKLKSAHVLKFSDWYETKNNLWLILEYCTGGDLESLLKQDGHLPETSIRIFGLDILAGVKYIHNLGMIHCDIRPRNFLVDGYGILKLSDFKLVQRIPDRVIGDMNFAMRGSPPYMAPELFREDGVHSFQSDFWAVGCLMYELRRGEPPFGDSETSIAQLQNNIRTVEPVNSPTVSTSRGGNKECERKSVSIPSISAELADLLLWLLEKSPIHRSSWEELSSHPYWHPNKPPPPLKLPPQPIFDALVREELKTQSLRLERDSNVEYGVLTHAELSVLHGERHERPSHYNTTPLKLPISESTPIRPSATSASTGDKQRHPRQPLEHKASSPNNKHLSTGPDAYSETPVTHRTTIDPRNHHGGNIRGRVDANVAANEERINMSFIEDSTVERKMKGKLTIDNPVSPVNNTNRLHSQTNDDVRSAHQHDTNLQGMTSLRDNNFQNNDDELDVDDNHDEFSVFSLLTHNSDTQVRPIVGNKQIETIERTECKTSSLPFEALTLENLQVLSRAEIERFLYPVFTTLRKLSQTAQSSTPTAIALNAMQDRLNILAYLNVVAGVAEVSNTVLDGAFLSVILKLMKTVPLYTVSNINSAYGQRASGKSANVSGAATLISNLTAAANMSRTLSATLLATMLRYATNINPPAIRAREDHIVATVVNILRDGGRMETRFRRRMVAVLGEMVFYIASQEEDTEQISDGTEKWLLPNTAVDMICRCLRDDSDEVVRHYAAKTLENVFAKGGLEFKRRFTSFDVAVRLLELSLTAADSSNSDVLQATCGMALSHMFLSLAVPNHLPPISSTAASSEGNGGKDPLSTTFRKGANPLGNTVSIGPDPFAHPLPVSAAKFIARVLEKGNGLAGILDTLQEGQSKLQQAYLNILNLVFALPLHIEKYLEIRPVVEEPTTRKTKATTPVKSSLLTEDAISLTHAVNVALKTTRNYFLKSQVTIPTIVRLIEQGSTNYIKGKALLTAQFICTRQPAALSILSERRIPHVLARILEPVVSRHQAILSGDEDDGGALPEMTYLEKIAMSMVRFIRSACEDSTRVICDQLQLIISEDTHTVTTSSTGDETTSANVIHKTPERSPSKRHKTPGSSIPTTKTPSGGAAQERVGFDFVQLNTAADVLLATVTIGSQSMLQRLILTFDDKFVKCLSKALTVLMALQSMHSILTKSAHWNEIESTIAVCEQSCLKSLEAIAQIDLLESSSSYPAPQSVSARNRVPLSPVRNNGEHRTPDNVQKVIPQMEGWGRFVRCVAASLLPAVCELMSHPDDNVRVLVASPLRRLLPSCVRACLRQIGGLTVSDAESCVTVFIARCDRWLCDVQPIPQYTMRLLIDMAGVSRAIITTMIRELKRSNIAPLLIRMLKDGSTQNRGSNELDPQVVMVLCAISEHQEGVALLLENDLAAALSSAFIGTVYASPSPSSITSTMNPNDEFIHINKELVQLSLDLLYTTLHFVLQTLSIASQSRSPEKLHYAEQFRKLAGPLRANTPALFLVFAKADRYLDHVTELIRSQRSVQQSSIWEEFKELSVAYGQLAETASVCLVILFDLFQEAVTTQIMARQQVTIDDSVKTTTITGFSDSLSPRMVLAKVIGNRLIDYNIRNRLLKVVMAVSKLSVSVNMINKAKDLLLQEPLTGVLHECLKSSPYAHELSIGTNNKSNETVVEDHENYKSCIRELTDWARTL